MPFIVASIVLLTAARPCGDGLEYFKLFRDEILPRWFTISPKELRSLVPVELQIIADGSGPLLTPIETRACGAQFAFSGSTEANQQLDNVTFVFRGPKTALESLSKELAKETDFEFEEEDVKQFKQGDIVQFGRRSPEDPRQPGIVTMMSMKLEPKSTWELEFQFKQYRDPK